MTEEHAPHVAVEPDTDLSGRSFGDYRLLRRLGRGGMADVYLAEQQSLHRRVAFKVLKSSLARDSSYVRRFVHEAQAAASLTHANIVQIHDVGCIDGWHYIAQEYVEGQNLKQHLLRRGTLDAVSTVHILRQVAAALSKAGQHKLTHRDIKPENIMLSPSGEVKVADFGLARVEREGQSLDLTQVGMTLGTPLYMSPEQIQGRPVDTRSDLYSLGVTCYQMLAGRPPFEGETPLNIAIQHLHKEPLRLEEVRPDLPSGLCRVVHKLLAKSPQDRYQHAAELLNDVRGLPIPGLSENWPAAMEEWGPAELQAVTSGRIEATQQLEAVLRHDAALRRAPRRGWRWVAVTVAACLLGTGLAWALRPAPLLEVSDAELPQLEQQPTVRDQYLYAAGMATEEAWRSVEKFFPADKNPENSYYGQRAKQRLAEVYLQRGDLERAMQAYSELAEAEATQGQFRAIGLAGQANVLLLRGDEAGARQKLIPLTRLAQDLPPDLQRLLVGELNPRLRRDVEQILRDVAPPKKPR